MLQFVTDKESMISAIENFLNAYGEEALLRYLQTSDFYKAPASTIFHGNFEGGLLFHTYYVAAVAAELAKHFQLESPVANYSSVDFAFMLGLCHDLCKVNFYESYQKNVKNEKTGQWEKVSAYRVKDEHSSYGHGVTSVLRLQRLLKDEALVNALLYPVLYHMGSYDVSDQAKHGYSKAQADFPWLTILQSADQIAAYVYGY